MLIDWYLPGTKAGGPVRSVYSILNLLKKDFDFYVITLNNDLGSSEAYNNITPNQVFNKDEVYYYYFSSDKLNGENLISLISKIDPDLVYTNSFWSFPFSIQAVRAHKSGKLKTPILLAPRGMLGKGALGLKSLKKKTFLAVAKLTGWYEGVKFHATQPQEETDIRKVFPSAEVFIAPNINATSPSKNTGSKKPGELKLFFLSRISVVKNLHFALEVLRSVPQHLTITYDIFGNAEDGIYQEKCRSIIAQLPKNVSVNMKGEIPFDKITDVIKNYNALFLPTLNENYGHSIVESLLCGCPVIISDQTPWNDVESHNAGFALPLNGSKQFLDAVILLAGEDQQQFKTRSEAAINYISRKIDLQQIVQQYKTLFYGCARN